MQIVAFAALVGSSNVDCVANSVACAMKIAQMDVSKGDYSGVCKALDDASKCFDGITTCTGAMSSVLSTNKAALDNAKNMYGSKCTGSGGSDSGPSTIDCVKQMETCLTEATTLQKQDSIPLTPPKIVLIHYFFFARRDVAFDQ